MSQRTEQFGENVLHALSELIRIEVELPLDIFVSITEVDVSPDLKNANVYITVFPSNKQGTALDILRKNGAMLRSKLAKKNQAKVTPFLNFEIDSVEVAATKVDEILDDLPDIA